MLSDIQLIVKNNLDEKYEKLNDTIWSVKPMTIKEKFLRKG